MDRTVEHHDLISNFNNTSGDSDLARIYSYCYLSFP